MADISRRSGGPCVDNALSVAANRLVGKGSKRAWLLKQNCRHVFLRAAGVEHPPECLNALILIWEWNDAPGRTGAEVRAALVKAVAATAPDPLSSLAEPPDHARYASPTRTGEGQHTPARARAPFPRRGVSRAGDDFATTTAGACAAPAVESPDLGGERAEF